MGLVYRAPHRVGPVPVADTFKHGSSDILVVTQKVRVVGHMVTVPG